MSKSQNTKNEQQKDLCITSEQLTEQWKKGKLPYAEYYIKLVGGEYTNDVWDIGGWQSFNKKGDVVAEVLAPVPSYKEWKAKLEENTRLKERNDSLNNRDINLCRIANGIREENFALKELLKEVKDYLPEFETPMDILAKIDEALK